MPKRPRQHELEDESRRGFEQSLGPRFVYRRQESDYGIDGEVEEFRDGRATGVKYLVQLKATDEADLAKALSVRIDLDRADYYRSLALPVLMIRYHAVGGRLFARWFHAYTGPEPGPEQQSLLFRWHETDEWTAESPAGAAREARAFVALRQASLELPVSFEIESDEVVLGLSAPEIRIAIGHAARRAADLIDLDGSAEPLGRFFATADRVGAHLSGVSGATFTPGEDYDPGSGGERLAADVLVAAGLAFWRIGQADVASRLAALFLHEAQELRSPDVIMSFMTAMVQARRVTEALRTWDRLDALGDDHSRTAGFFFSFVATRLSRSLAPEEAAAFVDTTMRAIGRRLDEGKPEEAGSPYYNLALHHAARAEPEEALRCYEGAAEYDGRYLGRAYYWREKAGILFILRRYEESAEAYDRAVQLGSDHFTLALHADALLFAGRYRLARETLAQFVANWAMPEPGAEWALKAILVDEILDRFGLDEQERDTDGAGGLAGRLAEEAPDDPILGKRLCEDALRLDALSPLPWFNMGRADLDLGNARAAGFDYLAAALLREDDPEAWVNAFTLLWQEDVTGLLPLIFVTADRFTDGRFMPRLAEFTREQSPDFPRADFLDAVNDMASRLPREGASDINYVRVMHGDGRIEMLPLVGDSGGRAVARRSHVAAHRSLADVGCRQRVTPSRWPPRSCPPTT